MRDGEVDNNKVYVSIEREEGRVRDGEVDNNNNH